MDFVVSFVLAVIVFMLIVMFIVRYNPQKNTKPLKIIFLLMFILGIVTYYYCNYMVVEEVVNGTLKEKSLEWLQNEDASRLYRVSYIVMRTVIDVGMMFSGRANSEVFYSLPESKNPFFVFLFWALHTIAFFTTSSALLIRFGGDFLRWLRKINPCVTDVDLIFGVNEDSIAFGRKIADKKRSMLVYVDGTVSEYYETAIHDFGGLVYSGTDALKATESFLKDILFLKGISRTKLRLCALSGEYDKNFRYATMVRESLKVLNVQPEQTQLILLGTDEQNGMSFQVNEHEYGYGSVVAFDEREMTARLLTFEYPLCNAIKFDENGRATENMEVLIIGVGRIGHEVLREVISNGQFAGSDFHLTIYDPKFNRSKDFFISHYLAMYANYYIDFEPKEGKSNTLFQFIQENASTLKYIAICLEDREAARNLAVRMVDTLKTKGYPQNVYTCDSKSVRCYSSETQECKTHWIYDSEIIYSGELDRYAMKLHHRYELLQGKTDSLEEAWKKCRYFHRMSSRASVDYLIPLIRKIMNAEKTLTSEQRENLAQSEHLRWCAFLYTFGYDVMERYEFIQRIYKQEEDIRKFGSSKIKPREDAEQRKHLCLVSWDELDYISWLENYLTHSNKDYKELDRENVDMVKGILQSETLREDT